MVYIKFMVIETLKKSIAKIPLLYFCMLLTMPLFCTPTILFLKNGNGVLELHC